MTDHGEQPVHLTRELLHAVRRGALSRDLLCAFAVRHAIDQCDECRQGFLGYMGDVYGMPGVPDRVPEEAYEGSLVRTAALLAAVDLREERQTVRHDFAELLRIPSEQRRLRMESEETRFRSPLLAELLIEQAREAVLRDPQESFDLAQLAVDVSHRIEPATHGTGLRFEALGRATAYVANALRARGDLALAERRFRVAMGCFERGETGDPLVRAELDGLLASLRSDQRRFEEARRLLQRVIPTYTAAGEHPRAARFLLKKAMVLYFMERPEDAVTDLVEVGNLVTPKEDAWICLCAEHLLALILCEMGRPEEASARVEINRELYERFGERTRFRRQWVQAKVAHGRGKRSEAERLYRAARDGFVEQQTGYDAALVSLDLAALYLDQERSREVRQLAEEMLPIFRSQDIHREAMAALLLFHDAAQKETASLPLVRRITRYLQQARNNPKLRFEEMEG